MTEPVIKEVFGPIGNSTLFVTIVRGIYGGKNYTVCFSSARDEMMEDLISRDLPVFFKIALDSLLNTLKSPSETSVFLLLLTKEEIQENAEISMYLDVLNTSETELERIADDALKNLLFIKYNKEINNKKYIISESGQSFDIYNPENGLSFPVTAVKHGKDVLELLGEMAPDLDEYHSDLYWHETGAYVASNDPKKAFRSFYYFLKLRSADSDKITHEQIIAAGATVYQLLADTLNSDYAELIAELTAEFAERHNLHADALNAWKQAGMASQTMGRIQETRDNYDRGLRLEKNVPDKRAKAKMHHSYAISMMMLLQHLDFEDRKTFSEKSGDEIIDVAEIHFGAALDLLENEQEEEALWMKSAIKLESIRIAAHRGDLERAVEEFSLLGQSKDFFPEMRLLATLGIYKLAACKKLSEAEGGGSVIFEKCLKEVSESFGDKIIRYPDKRCFYLIYWGDYYLEKKIYDKAAECYKAACDVQFSFSSKEIRPSPSDLKYGDYGGLAAIDIGARLQEALLNLTDQSKAVYGDYEPNLLACLLAEHSKGKFLKRDLGFLAIGVAKNTGAIVSNKIFNLRRSLVNGNLDHRIAMCDYEWISGEHLTSPSADVKPRDLISSGKFLKRQDIVETLHTPGNKTACLSFYEKSDETLIYIVDDSAEQLDVVKVPIGRRDLKKIFLTLQTGINGDGRSLLPIDSRRTDSRRKYFDGFFRLREHLEPLFSKLENVDIIYLSTHGIWHNLPLHALLYPALWRAGKMPDIRYILSLSFLKLLKERQHRNRTKEFSGIDLTVVPALEDDAALFAAITTKLETVFSQTDAGLSKTFGADSTATRFINAMQSSGIHHILAHGYFDSVDNPMNSGILLADDNGLPSKKNIFNRDFSKNNVFSSAMMILNQTVADHITLQACSTGQSFAARGDEFWGMPRACLIAGADSVVAPLWNTDIENSTGLLAVFYENWLIKKMSKHRAIADAQRTVWLTDHENQSNFYNWASFQLIGN